MKPAPPTRQVALEARPYKQGAHGPIETALKLEASFDPITFEVARRMAAEQGIPAAEWLRALVEKVTMERCMEAILHRDAQHYSSSNYSVKIHQVGRKCK